MAKPVRRHAGYELELVQHGMEPSDFKPMNRIGHGVNEIRIHLAGEYRVLYVARLKHAVYVLHAFRKTSQKTSRIDLELAKRRYQEALKMEELANGPAIFS